MRKCFLWLFNMFDNLFKYTIITWFARTYLPNLSCVEKIGDMPVIFHTSHMCNRCEDPKKNPTVLFMHGFSKSNNNWAFCYSQLATIFTSHHDTKKSVRHENKAKSEKHISENWENISRFEMKIEIFLKIIFYFSSLRHLWELQIARKRFSRLLSRLSSSGCWW